jgi:hypothetical protein
MAWVDGGSGQWVWDGVGSTDGVEPPLNPPPSAARTASAPATTRPATTPPAPDRWPGWVYDPRGRGWYVPDGKEGEHIQWLQSQGTQQTTPRPDSLGQQAQNISFNPSSSSDYLRTSTAPKIDPYQVFADPRGATRTAVSAGGAPKSAVLDRAGVQLTPESGAILKRYDALSQSGGLGQPGAGLESQQAPTVDTSNIDPTRADRDMVLASGRDIIAQVLGLTAPTEMSAEERAALADRFAERATLAANSQAANARGGAGMVAAGRVAANQLTPQIQGEAALQARQEANQQFQQRVAAFNSNVNRFNAAGGVLNTQSQTALGAFGQEAGLAVDVANVGINVLRTAIEETGMNMNFDLQTQQMVGQMIVDLERLNLGYSQLDVQTQMNVFDNLVRVYGISTEAATAIKVAAEQNETGVLDYISTGAQVISAGAQLADAVTPG